MSRPVEDPAAPAADPPEREAPAPTASRELVLRASLATLLGATAGGAFVVLAGEQGDWVFFVYIGLFLGGLTGLAGFAERRGAGRGWPAQLGLSLALFAGAMAWGTASIFQAVWTQAALRGGLDAAGVELQRFLAQVAREPQPLVHAFGPLAAAVTAPALVRMRGGRWRAHLVAAGLALGGGWVVAARPQFQELALILGAGLLLAGWASAWTASVLARRWWATPPLEPEPAPPADQGPPPPPATQP